MLRPPRLPNPRSTPTATRGITSGDVDRAADALLRSGERPTIEKIRSHIGRGSPNTINPLLDAWWKRLAGRLDAGPAALHRLPESVLMAAEGLWMTALEDARKRATLELGARKSAVARDRQDLEVRAHVLSIRESELADRLKQSESRATKLEIELESLVTLLRKEQASRAALERRLSAQADKAAVRPGRAPKPTAKAVTATSRKPKPRRPSPRAKATAKRRLPRTPRRTQR